MKLKKATTETIKEAILKVNEDLSIDNSVMDALLNELELRISEAEFVTFCENLHDD